MDKQGELFKQWFDEEFPDDMGNGFGGWYSELDIMNAFRAGYESACFNEDI